MRRAVRRVWGLMWLVALLAGLPTALARYIGWPLPRRWPDTLQWQQWLTDPLTRRSGIALVAIALWVLWAVLLYAVVADLAARVRRASRSRRPLRLPPLPATVQAAASGLVGVAVFGTGTSHTGPAVTPHPVVPAAALNPAAAPTAAPPAVPTAPRRVEPATPPVTPPPVESTTDTNRVTVGDGGWVTRQTAQAIAASAVVVWRQRRRSYRPRRPTGTHRDDPDLTPLPAAVTDVQLQLHPPPDPDQPDPEFPAGTPRQPATPRPDPAPAPPTPTLLLPRDLPTDGVGLTGPAAMDAARGALIATLLPATADQDPAVRVVTTRATLAALLDTPDPDLPPTPGTHTAADLPDALTATETLVLQRVAETNRTGPPPRVVLIAAAPADPDLTRRVAMLLAAGAAHGVTAVLLGLRPAGTSWTVGPDGVVATHPDPSGPPDPSALLGRVSVLTAAVTRDLLAVHREAHPAPTPRRPPAGTPHQPQPSTGPVVPGPRQPNLPAGPPSGPRRGLGLTVLGTPNLSCNGEPVHLPRTAGLPILAFLALHHGGATATQLARALWPQLAKSVTGRIYTTMSTLRDVLDPLAGGPVILRAGDRYRLDPHHLRVDLWQLHAAVDAAATAATPQARDQALHEVVALYTGEVGHGWPWPWLDPHREATRRHVLDAYTTLAADHPDPDAAAALLQAARRLDPHNEYLTVAASHHAGPARPATPG